MTHGTIGTASSEVLDVSGGGFHEHQIWGLGGNDTIFGWIVAGSPSLDELYGGDNASLDDELYGDRQPNPDQIQYDPNTNPPGVPGNDTLYGGKGNDKLYGDQGNDLLYGGADNDTLEGGEGYDDLYGGTGNDTYIVDSLNADLIVEYSGGGTDTVKSSSTYTLGYNLENLILDGFSFDDLNGYGNDLKNKITGDAGDNKLYGYESSDTLDGGSGNNTLYGGSGSDTYIINSANDQIVEQLDEGTDTVKSSVIYALGNNLEKLTLTGNNDIDGTGNNLKNTILGNDGDNVLSGEGERDFLYGEGGTDTLYGGPGNDVLYGHEGDDTIYGGEGNDYLNGGSGYYDFMAGGTGNDSYIVDSAADSIEEYFNEGQDGVTASSSSYTLSDNLENLYLAEGTSGTGNGLNNNITGNSSTNFLFGYAGNDTLKGYGGFDVLNGGTGNDSLDGGNDDDDLYGGAGNDTLNGGASDDRLYGGADNDTYIVDNVNEYLVEYANEGTDTVESSVDWTIGYALNHLTLTGISAINGTGNSIDNIIKGNGANNTLNGGDGNDTLIGGGGQDTLIGGGNADKFLYNTNAAFTNAAIGIDVIDDFTQGSDKFVLDKTTFTALDSAVGTGFSLGSEFAVVGSNAAAATSTANIVYNSANGNLFYNQNGASAGFGTGAQFATLIGAPDLSATDFVLQA